MKKNANNTLGVFAVAFLLVIESSVSATDILADSESDSREYSEKVKQKFKKAKDKILDIKEKMSLMSKGSISDHEMELFSAISEVEVSHADLDKTNKDYYKGNDATIDQKIDDYVALSKTDYASLQQRLLCLFDICKLAHEKLYRDACYEVSFAEWSVYNSLFSLAAGKYNYLAHLTKHLNIFYKGGKGKGFRNFVSEYLVTENKNVIRMKEMYFFLEAMDPYHATGKKIGQELAQWGKSGTELPFLLWLEDKNRESEAVKGKIHSISTKKLNDFAASVAQDKDQRYDIIMNTDGDIKLTSTAKGKGCKHVGLSNGKPVMFAGEISFQKGEIQTINNHSGHFRPNCKQFSNFITLLKTNNLLHENCEIMESFPGNNKYKNFYTLDNSLNISISSLSEKVSEEVKNFLVANNRPDDYVISIDNDNNVHIFNIDEIYKSSDEIIGIIRTIRKTDSKTAEIKNVRSPGYPNSARAAIIYNALHEAGIIDKMGCMYDEFSWLWYSKSYL
jgi:hypothetical protein